MKAITNDKKIEKVLGMILLLLLFHIADSCNIENPKLRSAQQDALVDFALVGGY